MIHDTLTQPDLFFMEEIFMVITKFVIVGNINIKVIKKNSMFT